MLTSFCELHGYLGSGTLNAEMEEGAPQSRQDQCWLPTGLLEDPLPPALGHNTGDTEAQSMHTLQNEIVENVICISRILMFTSALYYNYKTIVL